MKLSARNTLAGIVRKVQPGAVNAEVVIELAPSLNIVSVITSFAILIVYVALLPVSGVVDEIKVSLIIYLLSTLL